MPLFNYRALDAQGNSVEGVTEADSARAVIERLQAEGLNVSSVAPAEPETRSHAHKAKLTWDDLALFNEQLAAITRIGLPIGPGLAAVSGDLGNARLKSVFEGLQQQMELGSSLSDALERQGGSLSPAYCAMVRAGEAGGNLTAVLESLTVYSRRMAELRSSLQQALAYPLVLAIAAVGFLMLFFVRVVPSFAEIFQDFGAALPAPTQFLVSLSAFIKGHAIEVFATLAVVAVAALVRTHRTVAASQSTYFGDWLRSKMLVVGPLFIRASLARFCRTLGMLLEAKSPLLTALPLAATAAGNAILRRAVESATKKVAAGLALSEALRESGWFPNSFCWFLMNAEQRGDTGRTLLHMAETYERQVDDARRWISMMVGPIMVICVALVVGFLVVSLYLPIFSLGDAINGSR